MDNNLKEMVLNQVVGRKSMENYLAELIEKVERENIEKSKMELIIASYKQLNARHKNIIDAQRLMLRQAAMEN